MAWRISSLLVGANEQKKAIGIFLHLEKHEEVMSII